MPIEDRIIYISGDITNDVSSQVAKDIIEMSKESDEDIILIINSDGGYTSAGLQLIDIMNAVKPDICVVAMGSCSSVAVDIIAAGASGKRYSAPNAWFMIHEASLDSIGGRTSDVSIDAKFLEELNKQMVNLLAKSTGQPSERILSDIRRDCYMNAKQAQKYGIVDNIGIPSSLL